MHGFLNLDKPKGISSAEAVRRVKEIVGPYKVGHGGTLDPSATGILPIVIGSATRFSDEFLRMRKVYLATATLGVSTDSYDSEGDITFRAKPDQIRKIDESLVSEGLDRLIMSQRIESVDIGESEISIMQKPPIFSALKREGMAAYKLARKNKDIDLDPRRVVIYRWKTSDVKRENDGLFQVQIEIECGRGFYVRSLVHDLGEFLGCGAHLSDLRRTQVGDFAINEAVDFDEVRHYAEENLLKKLILPIDKILESWPAAILDNWEARDLGYGLPVILSPYRRYLSTGFDADLLRAYGPSGELVAILERDSGVGLWKSYKYLGL
ncbi:MAG: tRNA pseudouridine(55) synthase TruB [Chloroflexota bacterium]|nr:tRNA pseudouridine(55) synthase TruB [Chloroflexota bacterium]